MLKKIYEPTFYLNSINQSKTFCEKARNNWDQYEENFRLDLIDLDCYDEEHDVYEPVFSSDEENQCVL